MKAKIKILLANPLFYLVAVELSLLVSSIPTVIAKSSAGMVLMLYFNFIAVGSGSYLLARSKGKKIKAIATAFSLGLALVSSALICYSLMKYYLAYEEGLMGRAGFDYLRFYIEDSYRSVPIIVFFVSAAISLTSSTTFLLLDSTGSTSWSSEKVDFVLPFIAPSIMLISAILGLIFHRMPINFISLTITFIFTMAFIERKGYRTIKGILRYVFTASLSVLMLFAFLSWVYVEAKSNGTYYSGGTNSGNYKNLYTLFFIVSFALAIALLAFEAIEAIIHWRKRAAKTIGNQLS